MQIISEADNISRKEWADFVFNHPKGNIFQTPQAYDLYSKSGLYEPLALFAISEGRMAGVLLAVIYKERNGWIGRLTSRSIIQGGPLVNQPETAIQLLYEYNRLIENRAIYSQFRNLFSLKELRYIFEQSGFIFNDHLDILIDLARGKETLWNEVHKNRKKEIRNGIKKGLKVFQIKIKEENNLHEIHQKIETLYNRIGLPVPTYSFFQNAVLVLEDEGLLRTFIAKADDKTAGVRLVLAYKDMIYDWYAASDPGFLNYRPNDVLPWDIITWGIANGFKTFDFGGAGEPGIPYGVREYKIKFGGQIVNYGRFTKIHNKPLFFYGKMAFPVYKFLKHVKL